MEDEVWAARPSPFRCDAPWQHHPAGFRQAGCLSHYLAARLLASAAFVPWKLISIPAATAPRAKIQANRRGDSGADWAGRPNTALPTKAGGWFPKCGRQNYEGKDADKNGFARGTAN